MGDVLLAQASKQDDAEAKDDLACLPDMHMQIFEYALQDVKSFGFDTPFWEAQWKHHFERVAAAHMQAVGSSAAAGRASAAAVSQEGIASQELVIKPAWLVNLFRTIRFVKGSGKKEAAIVNVKAAALICWGEPHTIVSGLKSGNHFKLLHHIFKKVRADLTHTSVHDKSVGFEVQPAPPAKANHKRKTVSAPSPAAAAAAGGEAAAEESGGPAIPADGASPAAVQPSNNQARPAKQQKKGPVQKKGATKKKGAAPAPQKKVQPKKGAAPQKGAAQKKKTPSSSRKKKKARSSEPWEGDEDEEMPSDDNEMEDDEDDEDDEEEGGAEVEGESEGDEAAAQEGDDDEEEEEQSDNEMDDDAPLSRFLKPVGVIQCIELKVMERNVWWYLIRWENDERPLEELREDRLMGESAAHRGTAILR
jgi:hypothetical protein